MSKSQYQNWQSPHNIAQGLRNAGHPVEGADAEGQYKTTTELCHGGDSYRRDLLLKLEFGPDGDGGTLANCYSADCGAGTQGQRELLAKLRETAGVRQPPRCSTGPAIAGDDLAAIGAIYNAFTPADSDGAMLRAGCPACGGDGTLTIRTFEGWPLLRCDVCENSYKSLYAPLTEHRFTAWAEYRLKDGPRRKLRIEPGKRKTWAQEPDKRRRSSAGADVKLWGEHRPGNTLTYCEGEIAAAALVSAGLNERGRTPITWAGGANKGERQSISGMNHWPVNGANVEMWADADEEGQGWKAMVAGAAAVKKAGAASIRVVNIDGMVNKGDAADLPIAEIYRMLDETELYEPPPDATNYAGRLTEDELSVAGNCARLLLHCPDRLLVVNRSPQRGSGGRWTTPLPDLYVLTDGGVWAHHSAALQEHYNAAQKVWHQRVDASAAADDFKKVVYSHVISACKRTRQDEAIDWLAATLGSLRDEGQGHRLTELTTCEENQLNADTLYLGTPDGVIDLRNGRLLPPTEGRRKLVTASIRDPYRADATHSDVDRLTAHYDDETADYVWAELGYSMRGVPDDRLMLMDSATGRGKTTLHRAVCAAVGGYGQKGQKSIVAEDDKRNPAAANPAMMAVASPRRIVYIEEVGNVKLDVDRAKDMSSGGDHEVRGMRENWQGMVITATVWMLRNPPKPGAKQSLELYDDALYRRLRLVSVPPLPESSAEDRFALRFEQDTTEGRRRRQALIAKLVRAAQCDKKPNPPDSMTIAKENSRRQEIGISGEWIRNSLEYVPNERTATADIWAAYCAAMGVPGAPDGQRVEGFNRDGLTNEIKRLYTTGQTDRLRVRTGGPAQACFVHWRLRTEGSQGRFGQDLDGDGETSFKYCAEHGCGLPFSGDGDYCEDHQGRQGKVRRQGRVALGRPAPVTPALRRIADEGVAILEAEGVETDLIEKAAAVLAGWDSNADLLHTMRLDAARELDALGPLLPTQNEERAAAPKIEVLNENLKQTMDNLENGATLGAETPDQLVNRALPQWWETITEFVADAPAGQQEQVGDGDDAQ